MKVSVVTVLAVLIVAVGAWGVGELHYRSCVETVKLNPPTRTEFYDFGGKPEPVDRGALRKQIDGCSRIP